MQSRKNIKYLEALCQDKPVQRQRKDLINPYLTNFLNTTDNELTIFRRQEQ